MAYGKRTVDTDNARTTGTDFEKASAEFNTAVGNLKSKVNAYLASNKNEASESVNNDWEQTQSRLKDVEKYLDNMGKTLKKQGDSLDAAFNSLKIT
jgi:uncharacterized protein YukE